MFWIKLFVSSEIIEKQTEKEFLNKIGKLGQNDNCYEIRKNSQEMQKKKSLMLYFSVKKSRQKKHEKNATKDIDEK